MSNQYTVEKTSTFEGWRLKYNMLATDALTVDDVLMTGQKVEVGNNIYSYSLVGNPDITPNTGFDAKFDDTVNPPSTMGEGSIDIQTVRDEFPQGSGPSDPGVHPIFWPTITVPGAFGLRNFIAGGRNNITGRDDSVVLGGGLNTAFAPASAILVGDNNYIQEFGTGDSAAIIGGSSNSMIDAQNSATIASSDGEIFLARACLLAAGEGNNINGIGSGDTSPSIASAILGGISNELEAEASVILGGSVNRIDVESNFRNNMIVGGNNNSIIGQAESSSIMGGSVNTIDGAQSCTILSSTLSTIGFGCSWSTIIGPENTISAGNGNVTLIGSSLTANHLGCTLLGDFSTGTKESQNVGELRTFFIGGVHFDQPNGNNPAINRASITNAGIDNKSTLELHGAESQVILASPDGTRYSVSVANGGTISVTAA